MIDGSVLQSAQKCFEKKSRVVVKMVVIQNEQEPQWLLARAKNVCDVFILLRIKVERK